MKKLFFALATSILVSCGGGGSTSPQLACTVEINGDSGMDAPGIITPPNILKVMRPKWQVDDRSVQGLSLYALITGYAARYIVHTDTWQGGAQLPYASNTHTANVVVIENGGIDALEERDLVVYEQQLRELVDIVRNRGAIPVFTGIVVIPIGDVFTAPRVAHRDKINDIMHKVSEEMNVPFAGWDTAEFAGMSETIDQIHRTQTASDRLVVKLAATLDEVLPQCK